MDKYLLFIPNLNNITLEEKKKLLIEIYNTDLTEKDEQEIEICFRRIMKREIRDIEKDIQNIS